METRLAENIRACRKQRNLTQEQLAEVLGVTVGAVHKWENKLSTPELAMIMEMADLCDVSVDVLLGYRMKDNGLDALLNRLLRYTQKLDPAALPEAEKALARYPYSFRIVYTCARIYLGYGGSSHDPGMLRRALELLEKARILLPQNDDPRVSDAVICGDMSVAYANLGEQDKSLELMKKHNAGNHFSSQIGSALAVFMNRPEDAVPYLSEAMVEALSDMLNIALGYVFVYRSREDWVSALDMASFISEMIRGLKKGDSPGFMDKTLAEVLCVLAYTQGKAGQPESARTSLEEAARYVIRFDLTPDYTLKSMRFLEGTEFTNAFDTLGATASDSIMYLLSRLDDPAFTAQWKEISAREQDSGRKE